MLFFYLIIQDLDISLKEIIWNVRKREDANQTSIFTKLFKIVKYQKEKIWVDIKAWFPKVLEAAEIVRKVNKEGVI